MSTILASTPTNPAELRREFEALALTLNAGGLTINLAGARLALTPAEALALSDFLRGPGARALIGRAWLAQQHAQGLAEGA